MNAHSLLDSDREGASLPQLRLAASGEEPDKLRVANAVTAAWSRAGENVHARVDAYLSSTETASACELDLPLPSPLATDLSRGGVVLRATFPTLTRNVIAVAEVSGGIVIRVRYEGKSGGTFYGILAPTNRPVAFDVVHRLDVTSGRVVRHRVEIDMRGILRQVVGRRRPEAAP